MGKGVLWTGIAILAVGVILYFAAGKDWGSGGAGTILLALIGLIIAIVGASQKPARAPRAIGAKPRKQAGRKRRVRRRR